MTLMFVATFASLVFLYQAIQQLSRRVCATLTNVALAVWGFQDGIFRRDDEWLVSHFYYGLTVALLMVFSLAIAPEIYQESAPLAKNSHCFKLHRPAAISQSRSYGFSRFVENSCDMVKRTSLSVRL